MASRWGGYFRLSGMNAYRGFIYSTIQHNTMKKVKPVENIDDYIAGFSEEVQQKLHQIRTCIHLAAPQASEKISYAMPTFYLNGNLVHFAAYQHHIGFYPGPDALLQFADEVRKYKNSKGAVQFPLDAQLPLGLVKKIVRYRVKKNLMKK